MWKSSEYCDFICTWHCDHDPKFLSSYNCIHQTDDWIDEPNEFESENVLKQTPVVCSRNIDSDLLEITSVCKSHHGVSLFGFNIISEARTVEVYSDTDGYLLTVKGHKLQLDANVDIITDSIDIPVLYNCVGKLDKPTDSIILKFLGVREKQSVKIYRLHFYLHQNDTKSNISPTGPGTGMIDMAKVKGYLHDMGDSAPVNGTKLLHAVEDYQQTQMSRLGGLQQSLGSGNGSSFGLLTSLLSAATKRPSNNRDSKTDCTENSKEDRATLEQPSLGGGALSAMLQSMSGSQNGGQGDSQGQGQMFAMLQSICGKVGKLRVSENAPAETVADKDSNENEDSKRPESDGGIEEAQSTKQTGINIKMMQTMIEQTVSQMCETSEQKLKEYIDTSLNAMESRLNHKLDTLMEMLKNGNKQSSESTANSEELSSEQH